MSPLERFIKEEDSRREIARIRRKATEALARSHRERDAAGQVSMARVLLPWMLVRRAVAWARQLMALPRTGIPPS